MQVTTPKYAFVGGKWVEWDRATVHISTHALHYGTAVFAGIRGYWNGDKKQVFIFRLEDHMKRLRDSCNIMLMKLPHDQKELESLVVEAVKRNEFRQDVYIRPLVYKERSPKVIGVDLVNVSDNFLLFSLGFGEYLDTSGGLSVCTSSWRRIEDEAISTRGKISGTYVNSGLAKAEATLNHYDDAILLTHNGYVSEGSAMNIFMVRWGTLITPPVSCNILEGITRKTVIELARDMGIPIVERPIQRTELYIAEEIFFCGTGVQIAPIAKVDQRPVRNPDMPVTKRIRDAYFDIVRGKNPKYERWLTGVY